MIEAHPVMLGDLTVVRLVVPSLLYHSLAPQSLFLKHLIMLHRNLF